MSTTERHVVLDASNTTITFEVRWFGVLRIRGRFARLRGQLHVGEEGIAGSSLAVEVDAGSVTTGIALRDRHLRGPRFLFADLYPQIAFRSTCIRRERDLLVVEGDLSLRGGVTHLRATCPIDGGVMGASWVDLGGGFTVSRHQFGVGVPPGIQGLNPLFKAIADDVHIGVRLAVPASSLAQVLPAAS